MDSVQNETGPKWYAVYTRPRFEKQVGQRLLEDGIEAYVPLIKTMRQWSDRKKVVEMQEAKKLTRFEI